MSHRATLLGRAALTGVGIGAMMALAGCGGGGSGSTASTSTNAASAPPVVNYASLVLDAGPAQVNAVNALYTTVTLCAPGSSTVCQTIDHVLVDTGSTGFRVFAEALGNGVSAIQLGASEDANGNALVECVQFADGYSWGSVKLADVKIGSEVASSVPIQVVGDPAFPASLIPKSCINIPNAEEDSVAEFGANGVLGIGNFIQDCGEFCAQSGSQDGSAYNACTSVAPVSCQPAAVSLAQQVGNPAAAFAVDNNGVLIEIDAVSDSGAPGGSGTLVFGIGTQTNNSLGSAKIYTLDPDSGTLLTTYRGSSLNRSVIDTGSNAYFFPDGSITVCKDQSDFFCPSSPLPLTAEMQGANGTLADLSFSVANADTMLAVDTVEPDLAGPANSSTLMTFDWGLPFFLGRHVFVAFEGATIGGSQGPLDAF